ncbi:SDR family NAD(P)-dependent oxidoreductase [Nannocystaceae bacterium ST9]
MADKRTALITGASSGIGLELARLFAADGHDLVLVARRRDKLEALAAELAKPGLTIEIIDADLEDPAAPAALIQRLDRQGVAIDYLVNNAGFGSQGKFWTLPRERELAMIDLNCRALVELTHRVVPGMIGRGFGRVLNIASTAAFQPGPYMATYYASKAFVLHFSEALAHELRDTQVRVTAHCPGATATGFAEVAAIGHTKLFSAGVADPAKVARHAYRAMQRGRVVAIQGPMNWLAAFAIRFTPRAWARAIAAWISS